MGRKQQETAPAPRAVAPVTVAGQARRLEEHAVATRELMARAAEIWHAAAARVNPLPREAETAAPEAPKSLDRWCDYTIKTRLTSLAPAPATAILIVDALRHGLEVAAAVIASVSDLGPLKEYEEIASVLAGLPRDDVKEAEQAMVAVISAWRRKQQAIIAAAQAAA